MASVALDATIPPLMLTDSGADLSHAHHSGPVMSKESTHEQEEIESVGAWAWMAQKVPQRAISPSISIPRLRKNRGKRAMTLNERFRERVPTTSKQITHSNVTEGFTTRPQSVAQPGSDPLRKASDGSIGSSTSPTAARRSSHGRMSFGLRTPVLSPSNSGISSPASIDSPQTPSSPPTPATIDSATDKHRPLHGSASASSFQPKQVSGAQISRPRAGTCFAGQHFGAPSMWLPLAALQDLEGPKRNEAGDVIASANTTPRQCLSLPELRPQRPAQPAPPLNLDTFRLVPDKSNTYGDFKNISTPTSASEPAGLGLFTSSPTETNFRAPSSPRTSALQPLAAIGEDSSDGCKSQTKRRSFSAASYRIASAATSRLPSIPSQETFRTSMLGSRFTRSDSIESFHCCGLTEEEEARLASVHLKQQADEMALRSALQTRPRPWPLAQQLAESQPHVSAHRLAEYQPRPPALVIPARKSSKPSKRGSKAKTGASRFKTNESSPKNASAEPSGPPSRFSSVSDEDNMTIRGVSQDGEVQPRSAISCEGSASSMGSPTSSWMSPMSLSVASPRVISQELEMSPQASSMGSPTLSKSCEVKGEHDENLSTFIPGFAPADPQQRISLRLTLPPTVVAKNSGLAGEQTVSIATSASALELKERICDKLLAAQGLSVSPSSVSLLTTESEELAIGSLSARHNLHRPSVPSRARSTGTFYFKSRDTPGSAISADVSPPLHRPHRPISMIRFLSLPHRRRFSDVQVPKHKITGNASALDANNSDNIICEHTEDSMATTSDAQPTPMRETCPSPRRHRLRMLPNCAILFEEGLQDNDAIVVRF